MTLPSINTLRCFAAFALLASAGAASAAGDRATFLRQVALRFPAADYLVAWGSGATPAEAEASARNAGALSLRSELQIRSSDVMSEDASGAKQSVSEAVVQSVTTSMGHLFEPQRELTRSIDGQYEAVAVVARSRLDEAYASEEAPLIDAVTAAWTRATAPGAAWEAVGPALCEGQRAAAALRDKDLERKLATGRSAFSKSLLALQERALTVARTRKARASVAVNSARDARSLAEAVTRRAQAAGYATQSGTRCASSEGVVIQLKLGLACGKAPMIGGYRCTADLVGEGVPCAGGGALFTVSADPVDGYNATSEDGARDDARQLLATDHFADALVSRLMGTLGDSCAP